MSEHQDAPGWERCWPEFEAMVAAVLGDCQDWPGYRDMLMARLEAGHHEYGDGSFARHPSELVGEIREEGADVGGWAEVLFTVGDGELRADALELVILGHAVYSKCREIRERLAGLVE